RAVVESAVLFLVPNAALDEHLRTDQPRCGVPGRPVVVGVNKNILVRSERIPRRVECQADIQVVIVVRHINRLEVDRARKPRRVLLVSRVVLKRRVHVRGRYSRPSNEGTIDGEALEGVSANAQGEAQKQTEAGG